MHFVAMSQSYYIIQLPYFIKIFFRGFILLGAGRRTLDITHFNIEYMPKL